MEARENAVHGVRREAVCGPNNVCLLHGRKDNVRLISVCFNSPLWGFGVMIEGFVNHPKNLGMDDA